MISFIIVIIVALEHLLFGYIEMFGTTKVQSNSFGFEESELKSKTLQTALSNQGIYNLCLGLMIIALLVINAAILALATVMSFVVIVGIYGALTVTKKILYVQALPAALALIALLMHL